MQRRSTRRLCDMRRRELFRIYRVPDALAGLSVNSHGDDGTSVIDTFFRESVELNVASAVQLLRPVVSHRVESGLIDPLLDRQGLAHQVVVAVPRGQRARTGTNHSPFFWSFAACFSLTQRSVASRVSSETNGTTRRPLWPIATALAWRSYGKRDG